MLDAHFDLRSTGVLVILDFRVLTKKIVSPSLHRKGETPTETGHPYVNFVLISSLFC